MKTNNINTDKKEQLLDKMGEARLEGMLLCLGCVAVGKFIGYVAGNAGVLVMNALNNRK
jgi:hypothetical protein